VGVRWLKAARDAYHRELIKGRAPGGHPDEGETPVWRLTSRVRSEQVMQRQSFEWVGPHVHVGVSAWTYDRRISRIRASRLMLRLPRRTFSMDLAF
jgi:hypothetical protein